MKNNYPSLWREKQSSVLWIDSEQSTSQIPNVLSQQAQKLGINYLCFSNTSTFYEWYQFQAVKEEPTIFINLSSQDIDMDYYWDALERNDVLRQIPTIFIVNSLAEKKHTQERVGKGIWGFLQLPLQSTYLIEMLYASRLYWDNAA